MVIEINKDIDRYKESVVMGLTAKQLIFSVASVVAPIALGGFYSFNGMSFYEVMGRKMRMLFANHPLTYVSTEGEAGIKYSTSYRCQTGGNHAYHADTEPCCFDAF